MSILENINTPIDPENFVNTFSTKFKNWGNIVTNELKETWKQNCLVFNNLITNITVAKKYVVSAPTGSAKTENTITYCAMIPKNISVLISTNLISEADRLANNINTEANDNRAVAYHSRNELTIEDIKDSQVLIVSHQFFKKNSVGSEIWEKVVENRDLIIVDEALDTMIEQSVHESDLNMTLNFFSSLFRKKKYNENKHFHKALEVLSDNYNQLTDTDDVKGTKLYSTDKCFSFTSNGKSTDVLSIELDSFFVFTSILEDNIFPFNYYLTGIKDSNRDKLIKEKIINTLETLSSMKNRQTYKTANRGEYSLNRVINNLSDKSFVCFDATSEVNKTYEFRNEYHNDLIQIPKINGVRDYAKVNLFTAITPTGSSSVDSELINSSLANITFGNRTLIITHKNNENMVKEILEQEHANNTVDVTHWNALTGLNNWQDFDTCVVIGLNHKPVSYYQNRLLVNTNEDIAFGEIQSSFVNDIKITDFVAEIIQAINRIRIRKVTTISGGCDTANIY